jgi:hypothetical protein
MADNTCCQVNCTSLLVEGGLSEEVAETSKLQMERNSVTKILAV